MNRENPVAIKISTLIDQNRRLIIAAMVILSLFTFTVSLQRSIVLVKTDPFGDFRNRVIGARLIYDGQSPYWYKWRSKDGTRYYSNWNFFPLKASATTATPFFLHLIEPIANWPQRQLCWYWLGIEYLLFLLIVLMAYRFNPSPMKRAAACLMCCLFLLTATWEHHIVRGQTYIPLAFLLMLAFLLFQSNNRSFVYGLGYGITAVAFVLIKPVGIFFFIPYLFAIKKTGRRFLAGTLVPVLLVAGWLLADKQEQLYWRDYSELLNEHIKIHQKLHPTPAIIEPKPRLDSIEGVDMKEVLRNQEALFDKEGWMQFQTASVYKNFNVIFHRWIPVPLLYTMPLVICISLAGLYYIKYRKEGGPELPQLALLGYVLYFIADIFAPVYRGQYASVQWLFPLAILPFFYTSRLKYPFLLVVAGLLLNIALFKINKTQYAIGEYLMCFAIIWMVFAGARRQEVVAN